MGNPLRIIRVFFSSWYWRLLLLTAIAVGPFILLLDDPFWVGVLIPSAFAPAAYLFIMGIFSGSRRVAAYFRDKVAAAGQCVHCGYDLTGNTSGVCPECGDAVTKPGKVLPDLLD